MKLLIVDSRSITDFDISPYIPDDVELIISGGARGIDTLAEQYTDKMKISKLVLRPDYKKYKRGAPLKRNEEMVDLCDKVLVMVFPRVRSILLIMQVSRGRMWKLLLLTI